jgi:hypothetical protein
MIEDLSAMEEGPIGVEELEGNAQPGFYRNKDAR